MKNDLKELYTQAKVFEKKLKEIITFDDKWENNVCIMGIEHTTYFYTFNNNKNCVSCCVHKSKQMITYVVSDEYNKFYYQGYSMEKALEVVRGLANEK